MIGLVLAARWSVCISVDNGLNPVWSESCEFDVINPSVALLRFVVQDVDMFGDPNFLGQATFPLGCVRPGQQFRTLWLVHTANADETKLSCLVELAI